MEKIKGLMTSLRENPPKEIAGSPVVLIKDFGAQKSIDKVSGSETAIDLPRSNVIGFYLADESYLIVRPSGTEPKIKIYASAVGSDSALADKRRAELEKAGTELLGF